MDRQTFLDRAPLLRRRVLLALVFLLPLLFLRSQNDPFNVPKLALLVSGVVLVACLRAVEALQGSPSTGLRRLLVPGGAISAALLLSWATGGYKVWALLGHNGRFQGLVPYLLVIVLGMLLADSFAGRADEIAWALLAAGALMGAYAIIQIAGLDPARWVLDDRVTSKALSTVGNPNFTGGFLGICLPVGVALVLRERVRRWLPVLCTVAVAAGWIASKSYGGWAAGLAGTALAAGYWLAPRWRFARLLGFAAASAAAIAVAGIVAYTVVQPRNEFVPSSIKQRAYAWQAALGMFGDTPLTGRGPNLYAVEGVSYRPVDDAIKFDYAFPDDPHSVPLSFLANAGLVGAGGLLVLYGWFAGRVRSLKEADLVTAGFLGGAVAYLIQSLVSIDEIALRVGLWVSLAGLICGSLAVEGRAGPARKRRSRPKGRREPLRHIWAVGMLALVALGSAWWSLQLLVADARVKQARSLFISERAQDAHALMEQALGLREDPEYRYEDVIGLSKVALAKGIDGIDHIETARASYAANEVPDVGMTAGFANYLHLFARYEPDTDRESVELYEQAMRVDPLNPLIRVGLADSLYGLQDYERALEVLESMIPLYENPEKGYENLSDFWGSVAYARAQLGDEVGAREAIELAFEIDPDDERATGAAEVLSEAERKE